MKLIKYLYHVLTIKYMCYIPSIHILSYFHKNSVKSCNNLWLFYWWWLLLLMIIIIIDVYWLLLIIIIDYWWWLLMIIKKYCNKTNSSSSIYKFIRPVLNFLFFFKIRFHKHRKAQKSTKKHEKALKSNN